MQMRPKNEAGFGVVISQAHDYQAKHESLQLFSGS